jgi:hypothetical protein
MTLPDVKLNVVDKDTALLELENTREQLLNFVNARFDKIKKRIENGELFIDDECTFPLNMDSKFFKGRKPTAVFFGEEKVEVKTWRAVYTEILRRCAAEPDKYISLKNICNKVSGRNRIFLSDKRDGMNIPIEIGDGLFAEGYFDTEWLLRILTKEILRVVGYDYRDIRVTLRF